MTDNDQSKTQVADDSQTSLVESLSEKTIRKELRSAALQHPVTILPFALCILSIIYLVLFAPAFGGTMAAIILLACSGVVAAGSFFLRYSVRYSRAYSTRVQEVISDQEDEQRELERVDLEQQLGSLESGFSNLKSDGGLKAIKELVYEYKELQKVIERKKDTDPILVSHIPGLAEETYRQGLSVLSDALEIANIVYSSDKGRLEAEITEFEKEINALKKDTAQTEQVEIREATISSHRERLDMVKAQEINMDKLLYQCDCCEASLHRTRIELAALKALGSGKSVTEVIETLEQTLTQAKEVQAELKKLGY